jgi:hypothetical protein
VSADAKINPKTAMVEAQDAGPGTGQRTYRSRITVPGARMFLFFSNRLGCLGSLVVSGLLTLVVLALLGVF